MTAFTVNPGDSIGTMTVNGNLTFTASSGYAIEVSPTDADRTNVTGVTTLAGTVNAIFQPGTYVVYSYNILSSAGGLNSTTFDAFSTTNQPANFAANLSYTATDVLLGLTAALGMQQSLPGNQQNVADVPNNFFNSTGTLPPSFLVLYSLTGGHLAYALAQITGEVATGAQRTAFELMNEFFRLMSARNVNGQGALPPPFAIGYASETPAVSQEVARAYAAVLKDTPSRAADFGRRWNA